MSAASAHPTAICQTSSQNVTAGARSGSFPNVERNGWTAPSVFDDFASPLRGGERLVFSRHFLATGSAVRRRCGLRRRRAGRQEPPPDCDGNKPDGSDLDPASEGRLLGDDCRDWWRSTASAPFLNRYPSREESKRLRTADGTLLVFVNFFAIGAQPGSSQLHDLQV